MKLTPAGELYFNNMNQIELTYPIKLNVEVTVTHTWAVETVTVPVTIYYSNVTE